MTLLARVKQVYVECGDLAGVPYVFSGGHNPQFLPSLSFGNGIGAPGAGYDCSSGASTALRAGGLLAIPRAPVPLDTAQFLTWGQPGLGRWLTVWVRNDSVEQHMGLEFSIATSGFYAKRWWQAANPRNGIGWLTLDTTGMMPRHWLGA